MSEADEYLRLKILQSVLEEECGVAADYMACNKRTMGACRCLNLADNLASRLSYLIRVDITSTSKEPG